MPKIELLTEWRKKLTFELTNEELLKLRTLVHIRTTGPVVLGRTAFKMDVGCLSFGSTNPDTAGDCGIAMTPGEIIAAIDKALR
ncbi:hypothetical protein PMM47T1_17055 [Pseudomonas sp. M47T1]|uniref:hypothetical protein n=1 Tax=Pseudomonas sp. M47T1 TaxID=1179778 RepID=UPI0002608AFF|nr:hypothetical protein [Pseudomonas sp. M47T1]EIK95515.1 hypothetical protein PMM47T1_17055 [Pseudomonas sp. M47T1]